MKRTSRKIWDLFELRYPHRLTPFRAWKRYLSVCAAVLAAVWIGVAAVRNDESLHSSGPMSLGHSMLSNRCSACHAQPWQALTGLVDANRHNQDMNKACLSCHENSIGHEMVAGNTFVGQWSAWHEGRDALPTNTSSETMACASCHVEHEGPARLVDMSDAVCVRCHTDLSEQVSKARFANKVTDFAAEHPEFDVIADKFIDPGTVKLNHKVHLAANLRGLVTGRKEMSCDDCHRAGQGGYDWPYALAQVHELDDMPNEPREPQLQAAYMNEIRYSKHCATCHVMESSSLSSIVGRSIILPHVQPEAIRTVLHGVLSEYIELHPDELMKDENQPRSRRPMMQAPKSKEVTNQLILNWVSKKRGLIEQELYRAAKRCLLCHALEPGPDAADVRSLPVVSPRPIPARWLMHASFDHEKHRVLDCQQCHAQASDNTNQAEVMLPSIETCRKCHSQRLIEPGVGGVSYGCVLCHTYHIPPDGPAMPGLKLELLLSGS